MSVPDQELVLWAGCVIRHGLLERAEAVRAGGFSSLSVLTGELVAWEEGGRSLAELRRELRAREAPISAIDPFVTWYPGYDPQAVDGEVALHLRASEDDVLRYCEELGARFITVVGPFVAPPADFERAVASLGRFADRAAKIGVSPHVEMVPTTRIPDLASAMALVRAVGRANLGLLLDTYNLCRAGVAISELDEVPRETVFQLQLADAPAQPIGHTYFDDALHRRQLPGLGELPLREIVERLTAKGPLPPTGPEVFADDLAAMSATSAGRLAGETTRAFLASLGGAAPGS